MKHSKKIIFTLISIIAISGTVFAFTKHHHHPEKHAERIVKKVSNKLELNEDQRNRLVIVKNTIMQTKQEMKESKSELRTDMQNILQQDTLDRQFILDKINQKADAMRVNAPDIVNAIGDFYDSLTPQQLAVLREHVNDKMEHFSLHDDDD